jgi:serine/threonine protein kinase
MKSGSLTGKQIGAYRVLKKLGEGGMGAVYYAVHKHLEREIALKILSPTLVEDDRPFVDRFFVEARAAASVNHPNVVEILNAGEDNGIYFIAMEFVRGMSLRDLFEKKRPLGQIEAIDIVAQTAEGLRAAYAKEIIHRDIKPANLMITQEGRVKIADFGLAKNLGASAGLTRTGATMGTPAYISPEQARGETSDFLSDLYSLGVTFFEMLTGRRPYRSETVFGLLKMHCEAPIPDPSIKNKDIDSSVGDIVVKMMAKKKEERHASYEELLSALHEVRCSLDVNRAVVSNPDPERQLSTLSIYIDEAVKDLDNAIENELFTCIEDGDDEIDLYESLDKKKLGTGSQQKSASAREGSSAVTTKIKKPSDSSLPLKGNRSSKKKNLFLYPGIVFGISMLFIAFLFLRSHLLKEPKIPQESESTQQAPEKNPTSPIQSQAFKELSELAQYAQSQAGDITKALQLWTSALDIAASDEEREIARDRIGFLSGLLKRTSETEGDERDDLIPEAPRMELDSERAVLAALAWLERHQEEQGLWSCDAFSIHCRDKTCKGGGTTCEYDIGVTGLALLAFLASGNTHEKGGYSSAVQKALDALCKAQLPNGCFGSQAGDGHWVYCHFIATKAITEAYGITSDTSLRAAAQRGIDYIVKCRNPGFGWRYGCQAGDNDTSVTSWALMALHEARLAGIDVPQDAFIGGNALLNIMTCLETFRTGYTNAGDSGARLATARDYPPQPAMPAAALACRRSLGFPPVDMSIEKASQYLLNALPTWNPTAKLIDLYYWYYGSQAMFKIGGWKWRVWRDALLLALLPNQCQSGCAKGSWPPLGAWGKAGGRVYSTALCSWMLTLNYRYRDKEE